MNIRYILINISLILKVSPTPTNQPIAFDSDQSDNQVLSFLELDNIAVINFRRVNLYILKKKILTKFLTLIKDWLAL